MKVKILKDFKDKHNGKIHKKGETMIISKERYNEILSVGNLVEQIEEPKKNKNITE